MKILLYGEFSGLFNCLKDGLIANGHEVFLASGGDGPKNYPSDFRWDAFQYQKYIGKLYHLLEIKNIWKNRSLLKGYDAVLLISPTNPFGTIPLIKPIYDYLFKNNGKVFLCGTALFPIGLKYWYETNEKYHYYVAGDFQDRPALRNFIDNPKYIEWEKYVLDHINGYIPIWYEYAQPYRDFARITPTVRIPINVNKFDYIPNRVNEKIVFFCGVSSRPISKGNPIILKAFDKLRDKYKNEAEFISAGGLPFNEYMNLVSRINVILDDANSYSIAMNGLFSLAKGKIVMGGAEPIANKELGLEWNPVYNLCPDVDQICSCIEDVISKKDEIEQMGLNGRKFVEEYHDYRDIAKQYVDIFEKY